MNVSILPASPGWHVCVLNAVGDDLDYHPVIAGHVFEADLPPIPVLAWGVRRPDPYALHFDGNYYVRGNSWQIIRIVARQ